MDYSLHFHQMETTQIVQKDVQPSQNSCYPPSSIKSFQLAEKAPNLATLTIGRVVVSCTIEDYSLKCTYFQFDVQLKCFYNLTTFD